MIEPTEEPLSFFEILCVIVTVMLCIQTVIVIYQVILKYFNILESWMK